MKRPGHFGPGEGGPAKRQFGGRGPEANRGRQDGFSGRPAGNGRDATARYGRPERGGFDRSQDRGSGHGGDRGRERGGFDASAGRYDRQGGDRPRSFDGPSRRPESRPFGDNQGQSYRRDGGMSGGYGRPARRDDGGFQSFAPAAATPAQAPRAVQGPQPVPAQKLKEGVVQANRALAGLIEQFGNSIDGDYDISQLEAAVSFDRDGRFIGFGAGGAVSFALTITPLEAEDVFAQDADDVAVETAPAAAGLAVQAMAESDDADEDDDAADSDDSDDVDDIDLDEDMIPDEDDEDFNTTMDAASATPSAPASAPKEATPRAKRVRHKTSKPADAGAAASHSKP